MPGLICWSCGKPTDIEGRVMRADSCPHCRIDLRCCRGCKFFDPSAPKQCREMVDSAVVIKDKSNFCDWFQVRDAMHSHSGRQSAASAKDDKKKGFDDLFND